MIIYLNIILSNIVGSIDINDGEFTIHFRQNFDKENWSSDRKLEINTPWFENIRLEYKSSIAEINSRPSVYKYLNIEYASQIYLIFI